MTRIAIIGGHGKVALLLEELLVDRGDAVTAIIRKSSQEDAITSTGASARVADVASMDVEELTALLDGHDAVVWSAGAGGGDPERTYAVDRDAAIRSMDAAARAGATRFVMVSWIGSKADHGVPQDNPFFAYADAKWAADEHLMGTSLDWTILGPGTLTLDAPTGRIALDPSGSGDVSRADVAAVAAAVLAEDSTIGRTIRFGNGDTPIDEAITA